jgi:hypothetical protein
MELPNCISEHEKPLQIFKKIEKNTVHISSSLPKPGKKYASDW